jgi:hypothetical protein
MSRPKNPNNNYFNQSVEDAIHQYNLSTNDAEKNKLFRIIYPALFKVAEVWYNKIKPTYVELPMEDLQADCLCFLVQKMHMVKEGKGKAFSYLTVTARNYYIQQNMIAYRKKLKGYSLDALPDTFDIEDVETDRVQQMESNAALFDSFMEYMEENFGAMFPTKSQSKFGEFLIPKLKENLLIMDSNRRQMLNEIASESGIDRGVVTKHLSKVASQFSAFKKYYVEFGKKPEFEKKLQITKSDKGYIIKNYKHYSKKFGLEAMARQLGVEYEVVKNWVSQRETLPH